jgi:hypothetical protein
VVRRLRIISVAKTRAIDSALAAATAAPSVAVLDDGTEGAAAAAADGGGGGGGARADPGKHREGGGDGGTAEYNGRVSYITLWLVLQPPEYICRTVAAEVEGRGPVVRRFHRRWWVMPLSLYGRMNQWVRSGRNARRCLLYRLTVALLFPVARPSPRRVDMTKEREAV